RNDSAELVVHGKARASDAGSIRAGDGAEVVERSSIIRSETEIGSGEGRAGLDIVGVVVVVKGAVAGFTRGTAVGGGARAVDSRAAGKRARHTEDRTHRLGAIDRREQREHQPQRQRGGGQRSAPARSRV